MPRPRPKRSRAYPAVDLRAAIQLVARQCQALGYGGHRRESIAQALGHAKPSGPAARKIAAMAHYGLLDRRHGFYQPTPLARQLLETSERETVRSARMKAFLNPTLFRELYDTYRPLGRIPSMLGPTLARDHGISESAQEDVASIFLESGEFAEVLDHQGQFEGPRPAPVDPVRTETPEPSRTPPGSSSQALQLSVALDHGKAEIHFPERLSLLDVKQLRQLLAQFEIKVSGLEERLGREQIGRGRETTPHIVPIRDSS